ncbi:Lrp/AsnC ligand binding domain-containing protein [Streptomyces mutabilis]|uniref:Lrp/AsnC ligand binding domain-containing protein n=1 Tax=Streptomyces mutabilis TaxID=67332 RepID=UPI00199997A6|nr:Lrp/AsnC ligand binding domain-containing protein [Streptomyces mutabilis]GGQ23767.1 hypothetical protein GCM10010279_34440 [Streptomyces mutabilis]
MVRAVGGRLAGSSSSPSRPPSGTGSVTTTNRAPAPATVTAFAKAVTAVPHVPRAQRLFGEPDHLLRVTATDLASSQELSTSSSPGFPASSV